MHRAFSFQREIVRAVRSQNDRRKDRDGNGVPVEQPNIAAHAETREECHREVAIGVEWNTAHEIARRHAKENCEQSVADYEDKVPEGLPETVIDVTTHFDRDSAKDEAPQNQHECQVITGEG